jgi:hypothetical protein
VTKTVLTEPQLTALRQIAGLAKGEIHKINLQDAEALCDLGLAKLGSLAIASATPCASASRHVSVMQRRLWFSVEVGDCKTVGVGNDKRTFA